LLVSDYDGTLADIVPDPAQAWPRPESLSALHRLARYVGRVIILSGRANRDLGRFLPVPLLVLRGDYGLADPSTAERKALSRLERDLRPELPDGCWLERKPGSLTIHHRAVPDFGEPLPNLVERVADPALLRWRGGRLVVEVMPRRAEKHRALREEIETFRPQAVIFAGDDTGDQGCFELVSRAELPHVAVGVRSPEAAPDLFITCDVVVDGPAGWGRLLTRLALWVSGPGPADRAVEG